jgi:hypothetical protein
MHLFNRKEGSMWRMLVPVLLLAGCAQLPQSPEDIQAKKFESMPDKSVIYVARMRVDSPEGRTLTLDERSTITTYAGTYYRWEVAPGTHRVAGFGSGTESVTLTTAPGRIYYVQHTVLSDRDDGVVIMSALREVGEQAGRNLVMNGELLR